MGIYNIIFATPLIIKSMLEGDIVSLKYKLLMVGFIWGLVAASTIMDFLSGIEKAKERGELRTSEGFRLTIKKCKEYYGLLMYALMFDCLLMLIMTAFSLPPQSILPFPTILAGMFLIRIELKSYWEKASEKSKKNVKENLHDLIVLLENREDLIEGLTQVIKQELKDNPDGTTKKLEIVPNNSTNNASDGCNDKTPIKQNKRTRRK